MAGIAPDEKSGNLVAEYTQGNVRIRVFDGYIIKSDLEKAQHDERISRICRDMITAAKMAGKSKGEISPLPGDLKGARAPP